MKSIVMSGHVHLDDESTKNLTTETKENTGDNPNSNNNRKFTADEFWNRSRSYRPASSMIRRWNTN